MAEPESTIGKPLVSVLVESSFSLLAAALELTS